ncbi:MAG: mandelate racemase/muconate lactonizing enzyme family protein [Egibacteraceae bacterium]
MTTITAVRARTVRVPLDHATAFSTRQVLARDYTLVEVAGDGVVGIGFCYSGSAAGTLATTAVRELLAPVVVGADAHRVEGLWQAMYDEALLHGRAGSVMRAISAVDIALWDRNARAAGLPLHSYLGAVSDGTVPAYASGGYYLEGKDPDALADEMRGYVADGFRAVKMKIGRLDPVADAERLAAVRGAVGPDVLLMLDANNAWRDLPSALRAMTRWEPYDPYWIEEPFSPDDIDNHARLAARTPVIVATGEIEAGRWRHKALLDADAAAILQTDAAVCGGISEFRKIAATADSYGVTLCPHWFHDLHAPLVGATPNARFVEFFPDDQVLNFRRLVDRQLQIRDGEIVLHAEPGLGFNFDEVAVRQYATEGWA